MIAIAVNSRICNKRQTYYLSFIIVWFRFFRCKSRLHELMQLDREFTAEDKEKINPTHSSSIVDALDFVKNPVQCCRHVHDLIKSLMEIVQIKKEDPKTKGKGFFVPI